MEAQMLPIVKPDGMSPPGALRGKNVVVGGSR
jgi:hypothetical protein